MGLAWQVSQPNTPDARFAKDGATGLGGFSTYMAFLPSPQVAISVLTNLCGESQLAPPASPDSLAIMILDELLKAY